MTNKEIIIAVIIHIIIPLIGLLSYLRLMKQMKKENIKDAPKIELFVIFSTYGGLLLVTLTTLFWKWSGIASLGTFYLILAAPILMGYIAYRHMKTRTDSRYHKMTYNFGLLYFLIAPITLITLFFISKN